MGCSLSQVEHPDPQTGRSHPVTALLVAPSTRSRAALYREGDLVDGMAALHLIAEALGRSRHRSSVPEADICRLFHSIRQTDDREVAGGPARDGFSCGVSNGLQNGARFLAGFCFV
jgi:hypothetical protein